MRVSCYVLPFVLPGGGKTLFMHGYTGAIDIINSDVAEGLLSANGNGISNRYDKQTLELLVERGYLTEKTQEEEHEYVSRILGVFKRKTESSVNFAFQLQGDCQTIQEGLVPKLDVVFRTLNRLRERYIGGALAVDLTRVTDSFDFLPEIIRQANDWGYNLIVTVPSDKIRHILPYLSPTQIQYLRIASKESKANREDLMECLDRLIDSGLKGEWLYYVDPENLADAEQAYEIALELKEKSKGKKGKLHFLPVTDGSVKASDSEINLKGNRLTVIPTQDVFLYHFIGRFIEQAGQINFRPYFSPRGSTYVLDAECNIFILPPNAGGESKRVGHWSDGEIKLDESLTKEYEAECSNCEFSDSCDDCHLSLMCGGACSRVSSGDSTHNGLPACAVSFKGRMERVLPLVLFNKLGASALSGNS